MPSYFQLRGIVEKTLLGGGVWLPPRSEDWQNMTAPSKDWQNLAAPPPRIDRIWVLPSKDWQNLGAPFQGLAESGCLPLRIGRIWLPPPRTGRIWLPPPRIGRIWVPPTYNFLNNTHTCVLWPYLSYLSFFSKISIWQNLGSPPPPLLGRLAKSGCSPMTNGKIWTLMTNPVMFSERSFIAIHYCPNHTMDTKWLSVSGTMRMWCICSQQHPRMVPRTTAAHVIVTLFKTHLQKQLLFYNITTYHTITGWNKATYSELSMNWWCCPPGGRFYVYNECLSMLF